MFGMKTRKEKSCGAVVFTNIEGERKYLVIKSKEGICGFPKGHVEGSETEIETARREILEETGLNVSFIDGFRLTEEYSFVVDDVRIEKEVVYFLCSYSDQTPRPQESEISDIYLLDYKAALERLRFDSAKKVLLEAEKCLM